jgi:uncharacterized protein (UPF0303 family)
MQEREALLEGLAALEEQERLLRYEKGFGSTEALALGNRIAELSHGYDRGVSVRIVRESDGLVLFAWAADDKAPRNDIFIASKILASREIGHHASVRCWIEHELDGSWESWFDPQTPEVPAAGAFPILAAGLPAATVCVSGLHEGRDHELVVHALEAELGHEVPALPCTVA